MVNEESKHVKIEIISSSTISVLDILFYVKMYKYRIKMSTMPLLTFL